MTSTLPVSEVFGPVWQGEGPHAGRRCAFLRLGLCNLSCEWCDTPYTWDKSRFDVHAECPPLTSFQVLNTLAVQPVDLLILSGGEPLLHATNPVLVDVVQTWTGDWGRLVDVETNGTMRIPDWANLVDLFVVSPKLWTGGPEKRRIRPERLAAWASQPNAIFKVVCQTPEQVHELAGASWAEPGRTWIMPEGRSRDELLARAGAIEGAVAERGFHFTLRQHTLMHGDERGH